MCGVQSSYDIIYSPDTNYMSIINTILNCALVARLVLCFIGGGSPWDLCNPWLIWKAGRFCEAVHPLPDHISRRHPSKQGRKKITRGISNAQDKQKLLERRVGSVTRQKKKKKNRSTQLEQGKKSLTAQQENHCTSPGQVSWACLPVKSLLGFKEPAWSKATDWFACYL